ncbi:hypothetical protein [Candidatus Paracaedibacter symbiosus]|uniref:hypothetical protein n=1 Tax=Candidatus Paracaedibacter symbiosus TaxID=244582 RepID=UPI0005095A1E|nr:hypothetical protein [Candidatus Paracaedibacter symbiosus]
MRKLSIIIATISLILAISSPIFAGPKLSISKDAKARKEYICNGGFTKDARCRQVVWRGKIGIPSPLLFGIMMV